MFFKDCLQQSKIFPITEKNIIIELDADGCTLEHMHTEKQIKAHFTNTVPINFDPVYNRVNANFDEDMETMQSLFQDKDARSKLPEKRARERNLHKENKRLATSRATDV